MSPQKDIGLYPQVSFTGDNEAGDVQHAVGVEMMKFKTVEVQQAAEKGVSGNGETSLKELAEDDYFIGSGRRRCFAGGRAPGKHVLTRKHTVLLQSSNLGVVHD